MMGARSFDFTRGGEPCFAMGVPNMSVTLCFGSGVAATSILLRLTPTEAKAMAVALEAAAMHAEATLPTGLGESEAA